MSLSWETHTVQLSVLTGQSPAGRTYDPPVAVSADVQGQNRIIAAPDGREIASTIAVRYTGSGPTVPPGSLVDLPAPWSRTTTVIAATYHAPHPGWGLPSSLEHWELSCE